MKKLIKKYATSKYGVPESNIPNLMKELNRNVSDFYHYMRGQTCADVDGECVYYTHDIERFVNNLPIID